MAEPTGSEQLQPQPEPAAEAGDDFAALLLREFKPQTERAREAVESAVRTLAEQALERTELISDDAIRSIESIIAAIVARLTAQINLILHHPDFQRLESAWRGLRYLVDNSETDEMLKIRVLNISKGELHRSLKKFKGSAWDQSPLFKKMYEEEYGQFGGEPYGCLVGDYYFDQSAPDVELLGEIAKICAAMHAPFIAAAAPRVMGMDSWQELSNPRDLTKIFTTPEYAAWRSLRDSEDARFLALTMPHVLARLPYGFRIETVSIRSHQLHRFDQRQIQKTNFRVIANCKSAQLAAIASSVRGHRHCREDSHIRFVRLYRALDR